MRGQIFLIDGYKFFTFGGAKSSDIKYRKEGITWWKEEMPNQKEFDEGFNNLEINEWKVDFIVSHTCPVEIQKILNRKKEKTVGSNRTKSFFI